MSTLRFKEGDPVLVVNNTSGHTHPYPAIGRIKTLEESYGRGQDHYSLENCGSPFISDEELAPAPRALITLYGAE